MGAIRTKDKASNPPPRWVLWLLPVMLVAWPALMYWMANHYSGWSDVRRYYDAKDKALRNSQGPTNVTLVGTTGRMYNFESRSAGTASYPRTEMGFDEEGFWIRGTSGGLWGAPQGAVFIPWIKVRACSGLRVQLSFPEVAFVIHDQPLLDHCMKRR
jgi:hypothetical protein